MSNNVTNLSLRELLALEPLVVEIYQAFQTKSVDAAMKALHDAARFLNVDAEEAQVEAVVAALKANNWLAASKGFEQFLHLVNFRLSTPAVVVSATAEGVAASPIDSIRDSFARIEDIESGAKQFVLPPIDPNAILAAMSAVATVIRFLISLRKPTPNPLPAT